MDDKFNGPADREKTIDSEIFNLKLSTLERRMDANTDKVVGKLSELVEQIKLMRESILAAALGLGPRHDGHLMQMVRPIITTLLYVITAMVVWFTGLREVFPRLVN